MTAWFSLADLAQRGLPSLPSTVRGLSMLAEREGWAMARNARGEPLARPRQGRGGGLEFHVTLLPRTAQAVLQPARASLGAAPTREDTWAAFEALPEKKKAEARRRLGVLQQVEALSLSSSRTSAVALASAESGDAKSTIYAWFKMVEGLDRSDRLPALAPRHAGGQVRIEIDDELQAAFASDWLRPEQPSYESCYRRVAKLAKARGLSLPPIDAMRRRLEREVSATTIILHRKGADALKAAYPHQNRDRSAFRACEAYVADTHIWDVLVRFESGKVGRPAMTGVQDLYSNKMLGWRIGESESADLVQLAFGDAFRQFGICDAVWLDNGRAFASKWVSGGTPNRFRFKVKPEDPIGMLTALGVRIHWTTPYSGQSKPIERAWRDFAGDIAKHPAFSGAYTGPNTSSKPANYGSAVVDIETFRRVVDAEIRDWNAREGRRTDIAQGRSFDAVFAASLADPETIVRRATPEQLRLCLLAAESVTPDRRDGSVRLGLNRYWSDALVAHRGEKLIVRFDPLDLYGEVYVYQFDGRYVGPAMCVEQSGFADAAAAREHGRARRAVIKGQKDLAELERRFSAAQLAAMQIALDDAPAEAPAEAKVVRPVFTRHQGAAAALALAPTTETLSFNERLRRAEADKIARLESQLRLAE